MVGPSAIGSENGTPSSITSAPASTSACITGTSASSDGSPAVTNGISALRSAALSWANLVSMRFIALLLPLQGEGAKLPGSEEHPSELHSLMRISSAVFCLKQKPYTYHRSHSF